MLGFTLSIYKAVLLKCRTSIVVDSDSVLTVQPNLRYLSQSNPIPVGRDLYLDTQLSILENRPTEGRSRLKLL